jgi:hypothetical protein
MGHATQKSNWNHFIKSTIDVAIIFFFFLTKRRIWCKRAHILWASVTMNRDEQHNELINVGKLEKR